MSILRPSGGRASLKRLLVLHRADDRMMRAQCLYRTRAVLWVYSHKPFVTREDTAQGNSVSRFFGAEKNSSFEQESISTDMLSNHALPHPGLNTPDRTRLI